jgi:alpha-galactosidase
MTSLAGLTLYGSQEQWPASPLINKVTKLTDNRYQVVSIDQSRAIQHTHELTLDVESYILAISAQVQNIHGSEIQLVWCAAATLPIPSLKN